MAGKPAAFMRYESVVADADSSVCDGRCDVTSADIMTAYTPQDFARHVGKFVFLMRYRTRFVANRENRGGHRPLSAGREVHLEDCFMPRGDKSSYTSKQKRQARHIEEGYEKRGTSKKEAERRAWATVNKETGGGKKRGAGRGRKTSTASARKGGRKGGARTGTSRSKSTSRSK
jgi:hypothetical protein